MENIRYTPAAAADSLSEALWSLSRPPATRPEDSTSRLFETVVDTEGETWVKVETDRAINVHADAVLNGIEPILLGAGIAQSEVDALAELIVSQRGQTITPWQYFPQVFKDMSKDHREMIAAGLLAEPGMP